MSAPVALLLLTLLGNADDAGSEPAAAPSNPTGQIVAAPTSAPVDAPRGTDTPAAAPSASARDTLVSVQVLPWVAGIYAGGWERALSDRLSLTSGFHFAALTVITEQSVTRNTTLVYGFGIQPGLSYYLAGKAPNGLWVGGKAEIGFLSLDTTTRTGTSQVGSVFFTSTGGLTYGAHLMVGYNHAFENGFTLHGGVGLGGTGTSFATTSRLESTGETGGGGGGTEPGPASTSAPTVLTASFGRISFGAGWNF